MRLTLLVAFALVGAPTLAEKTPAPEADERLTRLIAGSHRESTRSAEGYAGPGTAFLIAAAAQSQFVLIGESHGRRCWSRSQATSCGARSRRGKPSQARDSNCFAPAAI